MAISETDVFHTRLALDELKHISESLSPDDRVGIGATNAVSCLSMFLQMLEHRLPTDPSGHHAAHLGSRIPTLEGHRIPTNPQGHTLITPKKSDDQE